MWSCKSTAKWLVGLTTVSTVVLLLLLHYGSPSLRFRKASAKTQAQGNDTNGRRYLLHSASAGRLGNTLFHVASTFCMAIQNNLTLVLEDSGHKLDDIEEVPGVVRVKNLKSISVSPIQHHSQGMGCCFYDDTFSRLDPTSHHLVHGYFQSWKYVEPCKHQVLQAMAFKEPILRQASAKVQAVQEKFPGKILVGVHVRMEDYVNAASNGNGWKVAGEDYYVKAMTYFRGRFGGDVVFVVMASDPSWFDHNVTRSATDVYFLGRSQSAAVDLEALSNFDHFLMSVGTYGWWAAYKSKGTVVCYKDLFVPGSWYGKQFNNSVADFLHPAWVAM